MVEVLDNTEKADDVWLEENPVTGAAGPRRSKSKEEKKLLRKMDIAIVPLLTLTFFIAYMVKICFCSGMILVMKTKLTLAAI